LRFSKEQVLVLADFPLSLSTVLAPADLPSRLSKVEALALANHPLQLSKVVETLPLVGYFSSFSEMKRLLVNLPSHFSQAEKVLVLANCPSSFSPKLILVDLLSSFSQVKRVLECFLSSFSEVMLIFVKPQLAVLLLAQALVSLLKEPLLVSVELATAIRRCSAALLRLLAAAPAAVRLAAAFPSSAAHLSVSLGLPLVLPALAEELLSSFSGMQLFLAKLPSRFSVEVLLPASHPWSFSQGKPVLVHLPSSFLD
jgi:hypothetical protein